jgi:hypothetical protein
MILSDSLFAPTGWTAPLFNFARVVMFANRVFFAV